MFRKLKSSFKMESGSGGHQSTCSASSRKGGVVVIGLQSLIQIPEAKSNIVVKSALKTYKRPAITIEYSCYLKSCHLCSKNFGPDRDIYMYRGDQGFCSVECRNRQIALDEMKELEAASTKQKLRSYRHCSSAGRHETRLILEDIRRRNKPISSVKRRAIFS